MKKIFKHTFKATNILLYELEDNFLRAVFFVKEKPQEGDLFQTLNKRGPGFVYTYRIENIISISDSKAKRQFADNALIEADVLLLNRKLPNGVITEGLINNIEVDALIENFY